MEVISALIHNLPDENSAVVSTTGKTSRELFNSKDRPLNFYMMGSMGCAPSIALGIAQNRPHIPTIVFDGDGALLMRMEAMATIGYYRPSNYIHIVLDNNSYESTGDQATLSSGVNFPALAVACGYCSAATVSSTKDACDMMNTLSKEKGPHLIHIKIRPGSDPDLGRPTLTPPEMAQRFREAIHA